MWEKENFEWCWTYHRIECAYYQWTKADEAPSEMRKKRHLMCIEKKLKKNYNNCETFHDLCSARVSLTESAESL